MVEIEELEQNAPETSKNHFGWFLTTFIKPGKTMHEIASAEKGSWLLPLLLLTLLTLINIWTAGPLRQQAMLNNPGELPESFQYMSPEQQEQYMAAQASAAGPTQVYIFPGIGAVVGLWMSWFVLGGVLHLVLTLLGSRSTNTASFNLAAWASLPFAIRLIVQIVAMLTTHQLIKSPGLSGFIADDATGALAVLRIMLSMVDVYLIWQIVLLWIGSASTAGLQRGKALGGILISVLLVLVMAALPGFLIAQVSGLNVSGPMFFF